VKAVKVIAIAIGLVVSLYLAVAIFLPEYMIAGFKIRR
jgi:hypothetical protein